MSISTASLGGNISISGCRSWTLYGQFSQVCRRKNTTYPVSLFY